MSQLSREQSASNPAKSHGPLDIVKHRWVYIILSLLFLVPGTFYLAANLLNPEIQAPVRLGIDFTGGTMLEYGFQKPVTEADLPKIKTIFDEKGYSGTIVQIQKPRVGINEKPVEIGAASPTIASDATPVAEQATEKSTQSAPATESTLPKGQTPAPSADTQSTLAQKPTEPVSAEIETPPAQIASSDISTIVYIRTKHMSGPDQEVVQNQLEQQFGKLTLLQNYSLGPSMASELLKNGLLAMLLAYILIVGYLTFRFEFDYAICAIITLVHDALFVLGVFAIMGHFFNTEVDSMFITAILTVIGFSVHDTIVVYDRLRENSRTYFTKKLHFSEIANISVNQTLARSISTSMTALLTLIALYIFGGETTKDFVFACIVGIAVGTYSSIFVASALLTWWRERKSPRPAVA